MHLEALLAREHARTSTFQFHRSDEVIDACFTTEDPAISKRLMVMRLPCRMDGGTHAEVVRAPVYSAVSYDHHSGNAWVPGRSPQG